MITTTTNKLNHNFFVKGLTAYIENLTINGIEYVSEKVFNEETNKFLHLLKRPRGKTYFYAESQSGLISSLTKVSIEHL